MTHEEIVAAICRTLRERLDLASGIALGPETRLQEDLGLDSVSALNLIVALELESGLEIPETAIFKEAFASIGNLAATLAGEPLEEAPSVVEFEDIKVHCFISCLCEIVKACDFTDHRPFYFGVWDAEIVVDEKCRITNHSETINHDFFREWFQRLYGVEVKAWYEEARTRSENVAHLLDLLDAKSPEQQVMVMLDLHHLPERENRFNKDPFPHYVLLEKTDDPETLFMSDPDFRWEGLLPKERVLQAIDQPSVRGGFIFDADELAPVDQASIDAYFEACLVPDRNPLTEAIRGSVEAHLGGKGADGQALALADLEQAVFDIPLLAIRKYAYEHGLAFFWRDLSLEDEEFERWCEVVAELVQGYTQIQYRAIKLSSSADDKVAGEIFQLLDQQDEREFRIKARLREVHAQWRAARLT